MHGEEAIEACNISSSTPLAPTLVIPQPEMRAFTNRKEKLEHLLPISKWERDVNSDDEDNKEAQGLALSYSSSGSENGNYNHAKASESGVMTHIGISTQSDGSGISEEHRQKMRRLEVAVMEFRESLEERGNRSSEEIEKKVIIHRRRLQSEFGLSDSTYDLPGTKRVSSQDNYRKERRDKSSSKKRNLSKSRSRSPMRKSLSTRERGKESTKDLSKHHHVDRLRDRRDHEKSGSRDRDDHDSRDKRRKLIM